MHIKPKGAFDWHMKPKPFLQILPIFHILLPKSETGFSKTGFRFKTILRDDFAVVSLVKPEGI